MYIFLFIVLTMVFGYILLWVHPLFAALLAFIIVVGFLLRGLYLLNEIKNKLSNIDTKK
ncbi:hypothetical protein BACCIP111895_03090 [Neobacillus rhizosphaerae]|uniref:Uncharacterized protein n=1 Tax=Neobacillus rhizosphaerae TaxID=2880965 RepID=A0ABN8KQD9_9BACI|nr:hypothetical protein BACCIP111895_03090 [Neobacillus rhizosphaerae]